MEKTRKGLPEGLQQAISAAIPLIVVVILFVLVGNFGVGKVLGVQGEVASAQKTEKTLTQKLDILKTISSSEVVKANMATSAIPDTNPSLTTISQLKLAAAANGVVMTGIISAAGAASTTGLNEANISFILEGTRDQIFTFLTGVAGISPITIINRVSLTDVGGSVSADVGAKSFWAAFPKTIPTVTSPVEDLTADEKGLLTKISGLTQPTFTQILPSGDVNPNPFGQ